MHFEEIVVIDSGIHIRVGWDIGRLKTDTVSMKPARTILRRIKSSLTWVSVVVFGSPKGTNIKGNVT
jgi:hypothetical protein